MASPSLSAALRLQTHTHTQGEKRVDLYYTEAIFTNLNSVNSSSKQYAVNKKTHTQGLTSWTGKNGADYSNWETGSEEGRIVRALKQTHKTS